MRPQLHFHESDWKRIERHWTAWWARELKRPLVVLECVSVEDARLPHFASTFLGNFRLDLSVEVLLDLFAPRLEATHFLGDAFPRFWPNFGPGILAAFAGAGVRLANDTTWFLPAEVNSLAELHVVSDWGGVWWRRVDEVIRSAVSRWGGQLAVGLTDLGGNLDVIAHLRGTHQLLLDLWDSPQEVDRLVGEANRTWLECFDRLLESILPAGRGLTCWAPLWTPGRGYMLQCDFAYMISPRLFERFVMPDLEACCRTMDYAFYHLDGRGQLPHLDQLLSIPRLRGIQWVPGDGNPPPEQWIPLLKRIRAAGKLCQVTVTPEGALTILREMGGKGMVFNICDPQLTQEEGEAFLLLLEGER